MNDELKIRQLIREKLPNFLKKAHADRKYELIFSLSRYGPHFPIYLPIIMLNNKEYIYYVKRGLELEGYKYKVYNCSYFGTCIYVKNCLNQNVSQEMKELQALEKQKSLDSFELKKMIKENINYHKLFHPNDQWVIVACTETDKKYKQAFGTSTLDQRSYEEGGTTFWIKNDNESYIKFIEESIKRLGYETKIDQENKLCWGPNDLLLPSVFKTFYYISIKNNFNQ